MDIKEQDLLGDAVGQHWYYKSKAAALSHYLKDVRFSRILDVGAGSGFFSRHLLRTTPATEAMCVDPNYARDWDEFDGTKPLRFRRTADDYAPDVVLLMDVLEHVDDDVALLRQYVDALPSGTKGRITVPAFPFLWSAHDVFREHRSRYTISSLERCVEQAGLTVKRSSYAFGLLFPIAALVRLAKRSVTEPRSDLKVHHPLVNGVLSAICALELPFIAYNKWLGLSVFCVAEKP